MDLSSPVVKFILVFVLAVGWIYYRLHRSMRGRQDRHGRHLWRETLRERRTERMKGAATWDDRRRRMAEANPERRIADGLLGEGESPDSEATAPGKEPPE